MINNYFFFFFFFSFDLFILYEGIVKLVLVRDFFKNKWDFVRVQDRKCSAMYVSLKRWSENFILIPFFCEEIAKSCRAIEATITEILNSIHKIEIF